MRKFPFVEAPSPESLENSILTLKEVGAMNEDESLTVIGEALANLPVDVNIGKMLIMGTLFHQVDSVLSLAAALSVQSPFTNNAYKDEDCIAARKDMDSDHGDPVTLLNAYREWLEVKVDNRESSRKWCKKRGLEEQRFYEMKRALLFVVWATKCISEYSFLNPLEMSICLPTYIMKLLKE